MTPLLAATNIRLEWTLAVYIAKTDTLFPWVFNLSKIQEYARFRESPAKITFTNYSRGLAFRFRDLGINSKLTLSVTKNEVSTPLRLHEQESLPSPCLTLIQ